MLIGTVPHDEVCGEHDHVGPDPNLPLEEASVTDAAEDAVLLSFSLPAESAALVEVLAPGLQAEAPPVSEGASAEAEGGPEAAAFLLGVLLLVGLLAWRGNRKRREGRLQQPA